MDYVEKYLKSADRGNFKYGCIETLDTYGCGGVKTEEVIYQGRRATITREEINEFVCEIELLNEPLLIIEYRSNRKHARNFVERIIQNDIENNGKNMKYII